MNESTPNDYNQDERRLLIQDCLKANVSQYPPSEASIYPIIDGLKLLNQFPHALSFYVEKPTGGKKVLYTTLQDPELRDDLVRTIEKGGVGKSFEINNGTAETDGELYVCWHKIGIKERSHTDLTVEFSRPVPDDSEAEFSGNLGDLFNSLEKDGYCRDQILKPLLEGVEYGRRRLSTTNEEKRLERLASVIDAMAQASPHEHGSTDRQSESTSNRALVADWVDKQLDPMRGVLDNAYLSVEDSPLLRGEKDRSSKPDEVSYLNLFCAVRTATNPELRRDEFNYTARILLSERQRRDFEPLFDQTRAKLRHVEYELGDSARTIADTCFNSGTIDFSPEVAGEGRDFHGMSERDKKRTAAEGHLYDAISTHRHPFFVPIHVAGVPWLVLYTFPQTENDWNRNYQIYRTLIPKIAAKLRVGSLNAYISLLASRFATKLASEGERALLDDLGSLNGAWHDLTLVYPFPRMQLSTEDSDHSLELPSGKQVYVHQAGDNPYFEIEVDYRNPKEPPVERLVSELRERAQAVRNAKLKTIEDVSIQSDLFTAHDLGHVIDDITIDPLSSIKEELPPELKSEVESAIDRAKGAQEQLSLLLDAYTDVEEGQHRLELSDEVLSEICSPETLEIEGASPEIESNLNDIPRVEVEISREALTGLLMHLVRNVVHSLRRKEKDPSAHTVWIDARLERENTVCRFEVRNSGTRFEPHVIEQAGRSIIENPRPGGAGLGFYLFNSLLRLVGAPREGGRHFDLENVALPDGSRGAQVGFGVPINPDI